jgi:hypothetical protein
MLVTRGVPVLDDHEAVQLRSENHFNGCCSAAESGFRGVMQVDRLYPPTDLD